MGKNKCLLYMLCIGNGALRKELERTDRPKNGKLFSILGWHFVSVNKSYPQTNEPVIGDFYIHSHGQETVGSQKTCINDFIEAGWEEVPETEFDNIIEKFAPTLKRVSVPIE